MRSCEVKLAAKTKSNWKLLHQRHILYNFLRQILQYHKKRLLEFFFGSAEVFQFKHLDRLVKYFV